MLNRIEKINVLRNRFEFFKLEFEKSCDVILDMRSDCDDINIGDLKGSFGWVLENMENLNFEEKFEYFLKRK